MSTLGRKVGTQSQESYERRVKNGFFNEYCWGKGLDIGFEGYSEGCLPIRPDATGVDVNYPGYDGITLPFDSESQDYVYSSHCLEHISDWSKAISEWHRVVKIGGHIVTVVPHKFLYEKKENMPSRWNQDHKRFYTPASLLAEFESTLLPNSYRVKYLEDGGLGCDYARPPEEHSCGEYEITLVIQKIKLPNWRVE